MSTPSLGRADRWAERGVKTRLDGGVDTWVSRWVGAWVDVWISPTTSQMMD